MINGKQRSVLRLLIKLFFTPNTDFVRAFATHGGPNIRGVRGQEVKRVDPIDSALNNKQFDPFLLHPKVL